MPLALVTCGPAYEPIDDVRRITNFSTGELGSLLSEALSGAGFEVLCLRGVMAVYPPPGKARVLPFTTNASLLGLLESLPDPPAAIFHAAALCDFLVHAVEGADRSRKIRSGVPELHLVLRPAEKVLPRLRGLFPGALLVGWKYELGGSREDAEGRARRQMAGAATDACVVNGTSYGAGFGFLTRENQRVHHLADKHALCDFLATWTSQELRRP
ncbi:MAG TPA: phosphopantothenoylcysteine decarboxylase [Terrimicrobiaceae bacterium]|nr:phosphopantothenoylcysteine decarboxylase [Terrimicrobiaceae bacterium]